MKIEVSVHGSSKSIVLHNLVVHGVQIVDEVSGNSDPEVDCV